MLQKNNHIAVFSLAYSPFEGGAEIALKEVISRLPDKKFSVFTNRFNSKWTKNEIFQNREIIRLGKGKESNNYYGSVFTKISYVFNAWRKAEKNHKQQPFTAIWAIMASYAGIAALFFKLRHPRIPFFLTLQEGDSEQHILRRVGIFYPLWKLIFKRADHIQVISKYLADFAVRHGALYPIEIIPNGVDIERFQIPNHKLQINSKSQIPNVKTIITTSRLVYKNGVDVLIRAISELKKLQVTSYKLQVLGSGPEEEKLKNLARSLKMINEVEFLGQVSSDKIPEYLHRADIFVRASRSEGLGSSFLEAMAAGLPVIGTRVGGIPDFLNNRETGLFSEVNNHHDLAHKINELINNKNLYEKISSQGKKLVKEKYQWNNIAEKVGNIVSNIKVKKQILITTGIFPPDIGGPATYSNLLFSNSEKLGNFVKILTYGLKSQKQKNKIYTVSKNWPKGLKHLIYFFRILFIRCDTVYAVDSSFGAAFISLLAAKIKNKRFIVRVTGDYAWEQGVQRFGVKDLIDEFQTKKYNLIVQLLKWFQSYTVKNADIVITPSEYLKKIASGWGVNKDKIKVIYNAVEAPCHSNTSIRHSNRSICHSQLDWESRAMDSRLRRNDRLERGNDAKVTAVSAGRLVPWKGFDLLIEVVNELNKECNDLKLIIIGSGPEKENLELKIKNYGLEDKIKLTGRLLKSELSKYLTTSDIFVLNTAYEGFSHQIIEAMSVGLPVITTNVGGNPEAIQNGENGLLVEYNNKGAIKGALTSLITDRDLKERFSYNAKHSAEKFSTKRMLNELLALFG